MGENERCADCDDYGYVVTREADWGPDAQPEESEPCWCMASVQKGWISLEDHLRVARNAAPVSAGLDDEPR